MGEIKQSLNELQIVGTVEEINLQKETKEVELVRGDTKKKVTCDVISKPKWNNPSMTVKVEVKDEDGNVANDSILGVEIVNLFNQNSKSLNDKGEIEDNSNFKSLETVMKEYKKGTRVQINSPKGALTENGYATKDGNWSSRLTINGTYCSSSSVPNEDKADAKITGVIRGIKEEMKNEDPTGRLLVDFYMFNYKGATYPIELTVEEDLADGFQDSYQAGDSCQLDVELVTKRVGKPVVQKEKAFSRRNSKIVEGYSKVEVSVFGGDPAFEEEMEYFVDMKDMKTAMNERDIMIEQKKKDRKEKDSESNSSKGLGNRKNTVSDDSESPF